MKKITLIIKEGKFPDSVKGATVALDEDTFQIWINDHLDPDEMAAAFLHEMLHVWNDDFDRDENADQVEERTHEQLKRISDIIK